MVYTQTSLPQYMSYWKEDLRWEQDFDAFILLIFSLPLSYTHMLSHTLIFYPLTSSLSLTPPRRVVPLVLLRVSVCGSAVAMTT